MPWCSSPTEAASNSPTEEFAWSITSWWAAAPAGCVTASRLSEDPGVSVVLIEQGPRDWNPFIHMPVTYYKTAKGNLLSRYTLAPVKHQDNITPTMVQGRVLGGGSSVNAMVYIRGCPQDYDGWAAAGADGWSYREVLPFFKRAEDNERFSNEAHGTGGPLGVSDQRYTHPLTKAWLKACQEAGLPFNPDFNSGSQAGCGLYQLTTRNGRRSSAAVAYLHPAEKRRNLTVKTSQQVTRIIIEKGRAVGVEYVEGGRKVTLRAEREVILQFRRHRLAAPAAALRHRAGRASAQRRRARRARPQGRRPEPAGSYGHVYDLSARREPTVTTSTRSCTGSSGPGSNMRCSAPAR